MEPILTNELTVSPEDDKHAVKLTLNQIKYTYQTDSYFSLLGINNMTNEVRKLDGILFNPETFRLESNQGKPLGKLTSALEETSWEDILNKLKNSKADMLSIDLSCSGLELEHGKSKLKLTHLAGSYRKFDGGTFPISGIADFSDDTIRHVELYGSADKITKNFISK